MSPPAPESDPSGAPQGSRSSADRAVTLQLFAISMATITLQVVQVRIFSYTMNHAFVYMAISLAMVGFGLSGTVLSVARGLLAVRPRHAVAGCLLLFALSTVATHVFFARVSHRVVPEAGLSLLSEAALILLVFAVPYFFAGMGVALALLSDVSRVGASYFVNLVGSAAGCFAVYPFLGRLGAEGVVMAIALACALVALPFARGAWRAACAVTAVLLVPGVAFADEVLPLEPDPTDQYRYVERIFGEKTGEPVEAERTYARWDPVGKIEVFRFPEPFNLFGGRTDSLFFTQDAGAGSVLLKVRDDPELERALARGTLYGLATSLRPDSETLIIGLGGGPDLLAALANGARRVTGVEINAATLDVLGRVYRDYLGLPSEESGRLELVHADGRGFVRQFEGRFDVVQMTGADTYAASASSGSMLAENYLYTIEAFTDYLNAVEPDGLVAITRFAHESGKVYTTMLEALRRLGAEDPDRHVMVLVQGPRARWISVLTKRSPFTPEEVATVERLCAESAALGPLCTIPVYTPIGFGFDSAMHAIRVPRFDGAPVEELRLPQWEQYDLTPAPDDRPFFFNFQGLRDLSLAQLFTTRSLAKHQFDVTDYLVIVIQISLVSLLLIVGPLVVFKLGGRRLLAGAPLLFYFFGIGVGFMFIEIVLMQKCGLFMGHPNYSISTVLFSLLVFSGLGSWISGGLDVSARAKITTAVAAIALWIVAFSLFSQGIFESYLHLPIAQRVAILVAMIAPVGLFLGVPFPTCLREVEHRVPHFSPWALGTNGFASVVASLATIPVSMANGFARTLYLALAAYLVAWAAFMTFRRL